MQDVIQVSLDVDVFGHIVVVKCEIGISHQGVEVFDIACDEVVHGLHTKTFFDESLAEMRSQEASGSGDEYSFHFQTGWTVDRPMLL